MSVKVVRSQLGGKKRIYVPGLPRIIEEPNNVTTEESESLSKSESDSGYAVSECEWDDDYEFEPSILRNNSDQDIYSALLSTATLLKKSECKEFKHYQAIFDSYLKDYSTYSNNISSLRKKTLAIHKKLHDESAGCCFFSQKKPPVNTITNQLVRFIIHSNLKTDVAGIQKIKDLAKESTTLTNASPR